MQLPSHPVIGPLPRSVLNTNKHIEWNCFARAFFHSRVAEGSNCATSEVVAKVGPKSMRPRAIQSTNISPKNTQALTLYRSPLFPSTSILDPAFNVLKMTACVCCPACPIYRFIGLSARLTFLLLCHFLNVHLCPFQRHPTKNIPFFPYLTCLYN